MGLATAAIAAVGSVAAGAIGANAQAKAAKKSAQAVTDAADAATAVQREIYYDQRDLLEPSIAAGASARARQMLMMGYSPAEVRSYLQSTDQALAGDTETPTAPTPSGSPRNGFGIGGFLNGEGETMTWNPDQVAAGSTIDLDPEDYSWVDDWSWESSSPSYAFRFDEGRRALERSAAARGDLFSGGTGRELTRYGQDFASTEFDADFRRFGTLAGDGQAATGDVVQVAGQYGANAADNTNRAGAARASGYQQSGQAWGNFWGNTVPGGIGYAYGQGWFGK